MLLLQLLINGIQVGALYALIAVGFSLIFGTTKVFHVAHGSSLALAAYVFYYLYAAPGGGWVIAVVTAVVVAVLFGVLVDRFVYAPIQRRKGSFFTIFVASFGISIVMQNLLGIVFGRSFVTVATPLSRSVEVVPGIFLAPLAGVAIVCALVLFSGLQFFLLRTNMGMALRALSENPELVRSYGMSPRRLSAIVFALGSVLVVPAAILIAAGTGLEPAVGLHVMLISLTATIIGGVGSLRGAALAGLVLGLTENLALACFEPQWSEAVTFMVLLVFIMFRPAGIFGRQVST